MGYLVGPGIVDKLSGLISQVFIQCRTSKRFVEKRRTAFGGAIHSKVNPWIPKLIPYYIMFDIVQRIRFVINPDPFFVPGFSVIYFHNGPDGPMVDNQFNGIRIV